MNHGLVKLSQILPGIGFPEPVPRNENKPPHPKPPKVIGDPTRTPVNKQSALLISKASWLHQPLPPASPPIGELERLREENAKLKAVNENIVAENKSLRRQIERLTKVKQQPQPTNQKSEPTVKCDDSRQRKMELLERLRQP